MAEGKSLSVCPRWRSSTSIKRWWHELLTEAGVTLEQESVHGCQVLSYYACPIIHVLLCMPSLGNRNLCVAPKQGTNAQFCRPKNDKPYPTGFSDGATRQRPSRKTHLAATGTSNIGPTKMSARQRCASCRGRLTRSRRRIATANRKIANHWPPRTTPEQHTRRWYMWPRAILQAPSM
jgi:hypothetical protein